MDRRVEDNIKQEYRQFLKTEEGRNWLTDCHKQNMDGDFGDYLYYFYPEYLLL